SDSTCSNCGRKYHCNHKCFAKGGGREGQGPNRTSGKFKSKRKDRANQTTHQSPNTDLVDYGYSCHVTEDVTNCLTAVKSFKPTDWIVDSGTSSHI
ncbi:hypothetical protein C8J57DRAFT_1023367, partial [Mycena rebaudengoi]